MVDIEEFVAKLQRDIDGKKVTLGDENLIWYLLLTDYPDTIDYLQEADLDINRLREALRKELKELPNTNTPDFNLDDLNPVTQDGNCITEEVDELQFMAILIERGIFPDIFKKEPYNIDADALIEFCAKSRAGAIELDEDETRFSAADNDPSIEYDANKPTEIMQHPEKWRKTSQDDMEGFLEFYLDEEDLSNLRARLQNDFSTNQQNLANQIVQALTMRYYDLSSSMERPIFSALIAGLHNDEIQEMAATLSKYTGMNIIDRNLAEDSNNLSINGFIGPEAGVADHASGGSFENRILDNPYSVIVLRNPEVAHHNVLSVLRDILENGQLENKRGNIVDFSKTIFLVFTNVESEALTDPDLDSTILYSKVREELESHFSQEMVAAFDDTFAFKSCSDWELRSRIVKAIEDTCEKFFDVSGIELELTLSAETFILNGAREGHYASKTAMERYVHKMLIAPIAESYANGNYADTEVVCVTHDPAPGFNDTELTFRRKLFGEERKAHIERSNAFLEEHTKTRPRPPSPPLS